MIRRWARLGHTGGFVDLPDLAFPLWLVTFGDDVFPHSYHVVLLARPTRVRVMSENGKLAKPDFFPHENGFVPGW